MRKFTFRLLAVSGLVCFTLSCFKPTVAAPSIQAGFSPEGSALQLILNTVNRAEYSIRVMGYSFSSPEVVKALVTAHKRGVDVKIVLDAKGNQNKISQSAMNIIVKAGIPLRTNARFAIMHDKVIITDRRNVETGSFNFSRAAARSNSENVLVIRNYPLLADIYLQHWQSRWETGTNWVPGY
ncbi:phospholipase D family protein (plasmid) [Klebsiella aerogenes]|uniref:phospholipase D family nuclease n=1 Tax=Klebsiella aerogenes TaxID=548 RepID=UPI00124D2965|nr:phospholipase D family protein [Klebsiella aerogenes]QFI19877.1 phospholipase D family protein [Klebsiella aerogenes]